MPISRAQLAKELEPGLNALFGMEYDRYENEHAEIFDTESSDRAFEEEVMLAGFGSAPTKNEGGAVNFDDAQESFTSRFTHETIALAFSITEEAIEDNLYDRLASRYTRALARSMAHTKQVKAANVLNKDCFDCTGADHCHCRNMKGRIERGIAARVDGDCGGGRTRQHQNGGQWDPGAAPGQKAEKRQHQPPIEWDRSPGCPPCQPNRR